MNHPFFVELLLVTIFSCLASSTAQEVQCSFLQDHALPGGNGMILRQYINPVEETVTIQMVYPSQGFIGFAFSKTGAMIGSTSVIGLPGNTEVPHNPGFYNLGGKSETQIILLAGVQQTLSDATIEQTDADTTLTFTRSARDANGVVIVEAGTPTRIIYSAGSSNALAYHTLRSSTEIIFDSCLVTSVSQTVSPTSSPMALPTGSPTGSPTVRLSLFENWLK
jgi:hypothetical protein